MSSTASAYPFLDRDQAGGYAAVALYGLGIAAGSALFAWLEVIAGHRLPLTAVPSEGR